MNLFAKIEGTVSRVGAFLLFVATILASINAICRYGLSFSMAWADEVTLFSIVISVFLMQCRLEARGEQLSINVLEPFLGKSSLGRNLMFWVRGVVIIGIWIILVIEGWDIITMNFALKTVTSLLLFPMWIIFAAYTLGMALILVAWIWLIQKKARGLSASQGGTL